MGKKWKVPNNEKIAIKYVDFINECHKCGLGSYSPIGWHTLGTYKEPKNIFGENRLVLTAEQHFGNRLPRGWKYKPKLKEKEPLFGNTQLDHVLVGEGHDTLELLKKLDSKSIPIPGIPYLNEIPRTFLTEIKNGIEKAYVINEVPSAIPLSEHFRTKEVKKAFDTEKNSFAAYTDETLRNVSLSKKLSFIVKEGYLHEGEVCLDKGEIYMRNMSIIIPGSGVQLKEGHGYSALDDLGKKGLTVWNCKIPQIGFIEDLTLMTKIDNELKEIIFTPANPIYSGGEKRTRISFKRHDKDVMVDQTYVKDPKITSELDSLEKIMFWLQEHAEITFRKTGLKTPKEIAALEEGIPI